MRSLKALVLGLKTIQVKADVYERGKEKIPAFLFLFSENKKKEDRPSQANLLTKNNQFTAK